jgi:hypothetical protein
MWADLARNGILRLRGDGRSPHAGRSQYGRCPDRRLAAIWSSFIGWRPDRFSRQRSPASFSSAAARKASLARQNPLASAATLPCRRGRGSRIAIPLAGGLTRRRIDERQLSRRRRTRTGPAARNCAPAAHNELRRRPSTRPAGQRNAGAPPR